MTENKMILFCFCLFFRRESNSPRVTISKGVILVTRMAMEPNQKTADFQPAALLKMNAFKKDSFSNRKSMSYVKLNDAIINEGKSYLLYPFDRT